MPTAGWYNDPWDEANARYHDGGDWTGHTVVKADWAGRGTPPVPGAAPTPAFASNPAPAFHQTAPAPPPAPAGRREGRADGRAEKARQKAMRPWYQKKRFLIPLGVLVIGVAASAAGGGDDDKEPVSSNDGETETPNTATETDSEADDVTIVSCEDSGFGTVEVALTVLNNSSKASDYIIDIGITDASGAKVGEGYASTDNLAPGQTANIDGYGTSSDGAVAPLSCSVDDVERFAS